ncbi:MAG: carboxylesterase family protein [Myxococcales bacterium]|nr:carboxylesterase family protein [Myxococcales bacterium]
MRGAHVGGVYAFRGIPYAAAPIGPRRWRAPSSHEAWSDVRAATTFGPSCVQRSLTEATVLEGVEDCLTLNVWTPSSAPAAGLPVFVFLHGGSHVAGSASLVHEGTSEYDGAALASRGPLVVVTLQFRVGALGYMTHPSLTGTVPPSANFGSLDQLFALRWLQRNIHVFGGDRERITIAGQSSGASDVCALLASPLSHGLFSRAVMQSGTCRIDLRQATQKATEDAAASLGCQASNIESCFRPKSAAAITGSSAYPWRPSVDGSFLEDVPIRTILARRHNAVPVIVGSNDDELGTLARPTVAETRVASVDALRAYFQKYWPAHVDRLLELYSGPSFWPPAKAALAAFTDRTYTCRSRRLARALAQSQDQPVWLYRFGHAWQHGPDAGAGAGHGFEIPFVFQHVDTAAHPGGAAERQLAAELLHRWVRFADVGAPQHPSLPVWPAHSIGGSYLRLDVPSEVLSLATDEQCAFWDEREP